MPSTPSSITINASDVTIKAHRRGNTEAFKMRFTGPLAFERVERHRSVEKFVRKPSAIRLQRFQLETVSESTSEYEEEESE
eukprot:CAMPEP_0184709476 /NCGR_PEP_ID=MMETSP0314-20130426/612_1 /TAXON_ID=38298 /ORGANISM="Rhodella maculata, Strain CCMP 736" /LENGTH=80 /DNA_ID=CAMNT_0027171185 /DNA_START=33 /DNA_END=275 /DNA_ORIENTATION=+